MYPNKVIAGEKDFKDFSQSDMKKFCSFDEEPLNIVKSMFDRFKHTDIRNSLLWNEKFTELAFRDIMAIALDFYKNFKGKNKNNTFRTIIRIFGNFRF